MTKTPTTLAFLALSVFTASADASTISQFIKNGITSRLGSPAAGSRLDAAGAAFPPPGISASGLNKPQSVSSIKYASAQTENACFGLRHCQAVLDIAPDVVEHIAGLSDDDGVATATTPRATFVTQTGITSSASASMPTPLLPDLEAANLVARLGIGEEYMALLSSSQQSMFASSPLCFFSNVERMYESAAVANRSDPTSAHTTTAPILPATTTRSHISERDIPRLCFGNMCASQHATSTLPSTEIDALATPFFKSKLPELLKSVYAPPAYDSVETATTTCVGFRAEETFTARYLREATTTAPVQTAAVVDSGASVASTATSMVILAIVIHVMRAI